MSKRRYAVTVTLVCAFLLRELKFFILFKHMLFSRVYPYLCRAIRNFVTDHSQTPGLPAKEYYVSFTDVSRRLKYEHIQF